LDNPYHCPAGSEGGYSLEFSEIDFRELKKKKGFENRVMR
jgi:hypothetical protein